MECLDSFHFMDKLANDLRWWKLGSGKLANVLNISIIFQLILAYMF